MLWIFWKQTPLVMSLEFSDVAKFYLQVTHINVNVIRILGCNNITICYPENTTLNVPKRQMNKFIFSPSFGISGQGDKFFCIFTSTITIVLLYSVCPHFIVTTKSKSAKIL